VMLVQKCQMDEVLTAKVSCRTLGLFSLLEKKDSLDHLTASYWVLGVERICSKLALCLVLVTRNDGIAEYMTTLLVQVLESLSQGSFYMPE